jgi:hypothetical protein
MNSNEIYKSGLNYIQLINRFWSVNLEFDFTGNEAKLYFYLLHASNGMNWKNPFKLSLRQIQLGAGISLNSIKTAQRRLVESGLVIVQNGIAGNPHDIKNKTEYYLNTVSKNDSLISTLSNGTISKNDSHSGTEGDNHSDSHPDTIDKQNKTKQENTPVIPSGDSAEKIDYQKLVDLYHKCCPELPAVTTLSDSRKKAIKARVKEHGKQKVAEMMERAGKSKFLTGANDRHWKANLDWLFKPSNFVKILDGCYDQKDHKYRNSHVIEYDNKL